MKISIKTRVNSNKNYLELPLNRCYVRCILIMSEEKNLLMIMRVIMILVQEGKSFTVTENRNCGYPLNGERRQTANERERIDKNAKSTWHLLSTYAWKDGK